MAPRRGRTFTPPDPCHSGAYSKVYPVEHIGDDIAGNGQVQPLDESLSIADRVEGIAGVDGGYSGALPAAKERRR
jgi:hypothetical protein